MARRTLICCLAILLLGACWRETPVVIDGSSERGFEQTTAQARRQLPDSDRIIFDRALRTVGARRMANRDSAALARVTFDGMTASEVIADQRQRD